jgi:hypothetical protein
LSYYLLLIIYYLLFIIYYLLFIIYYLLFIIYYLLFIIYYLLFIIYYLLFIIYYLLFIIYYLLFIIFSYPTSTRRHGNFAVVHTLLRILLSSNSAVLINIITGVSPPHFDFVVYYVLCQC